MNAFQVIMLRSALTDYLAEVNINEAFLRSGKTFKTRYIARERLIEVIRQVSGSRGVEDRLDHLDPHPVATAYLDGYVCVVSLDTCDGEQWMLTVSRPMVAQSA